MIMIKARLICNGDPHSIPWLNENLLILYMNNFYSQ
jgi:hypothetical protein